MSSWWWLASPKITLLLKSDAFPLSFNPHWSNRQRSLQVDADFTFKDLPQMRIISGFVGFFSKPQIGRCHFGCHLFFLQNRWGMNMKEKLPATLPNTLLFFWWLFSKPLRMFYFYTNELHFAPEFLGRSQLVGSLASLAPGMDEKPKRHEQPHQEISIWYVRRYVRKTVKRDLKCGVFP